MYGLRNQLPADCMALLHLFFFSSRRRHTRSVSAFLLNRSSDLTHVFFCVSKNVSVSCAYTQGKREQFSGFNRTLDAINNVFRKFSAFHDETGRLNVDGMNIISNDGSNKLNRSRKARVSYKVQRTINARSEERFSRNAGTDLVCRLLLEKKNKTLCYGNASAGPNALRNRAAHRSKHQSD